MGVDLQYSILTGKRWAECSAAGLSNHPKLKVGRTIGVTARPGSSHRLAAFRHSPGGTQTSVSHVLQIIVSRP